jgi:hypothetical protein
VDTSKITNGDYLVGGGGIVFLIAMVLPWFGVAGYSENGLDFFITGIVPLLLVVVVVSLILLQEQTEVDLPEIPVPWPLVELVTAGLALLLVLARFVLGSSFKAIDARGQTADIGLDTKYGIFIAMLALSAVLAGVLVKVFEEGGLDQLRPGASSNLYPPNPEGL